MIFWMGPDVRTYVRGSHGDPAQIAQNVIFQESEGLAPWQILKLSRAGIHTTRFHIRIYVLKRNCFALMENRLVIFNLNAELVACLRW